MLFKISTMLSIAFSFLALAFMAVLGVAGVMDNTTRIWWKNEVEGSASVSGVISNGFGVFISAVLVALIIATVVIYFVKREQFTTFLVVDIAVTIFIIDNLWWSEYWFSDNNPENHLLGLSGMRFWKGWSHWVYLLAIIDVLCASGFIINYLVNGDSSDGFRKTLFLLSTVILPAIPFIIHTIYSDEYVFVCGVHKPIHYLAMGAFVSTFVFCLTNFFTNIDDLDRDSYLRNYKRTKDYIKEEKNGSYSTYSSNSNSNSSAVHTIKLSPSAYKGSYKDAIETIRKALPEIERQKQYAEKQKKAQEESTFVDFSDFDIM